MTTNATKPAAGTMATGADPPSAEEQPECVADRYSGKSLGRCA